MPNKKKLLIFPASMKNVGLLFHFCNLSISLNKLFSNVHDFDLLIISEKGEQTVGLWEKLRSEVPSTRIIEISDQSELKNIVANYLSDDSYTKIFVLSQGIIQFISLISLKRKFSHKLWIYLRLNSFKHGTIFRPFLSYLLSFLLYKYSDFVNFQARSTIDIFSGSKKLIKSGIGGVIPLGLSPEPLINPNNTIFNSLCSGGFSFVYLANFHKHKKHAELVKVFNIHFSQKKDVFLYLLGEGAELDNVKKLTVSLGLQNNILFPGRVDRKYIPWILSHANSSVVLSSVETFGHNILEPLYYGCPVISTNIGIAPEVITDFYNGFIVPFNNLDLVGQKMYFLYKNKDVCKQMGNSSTEFIKQKYSWDSISRMYLTLLSDL